MKKLPKVSIVGLGYVGFPLANIVAKSKKYSVFGFDINQTAIKKITSGIAPISDTETTKNLKKFDFSVSNDPNILKDSDYYIICVPTPVFKNHLPDLRPVKNAAKTIAKFLKKGQTVILESTVNPGVCRKVILPILEQSGLTGGRDFELAHCPERINPGDAKWNVSNIPRNISALTKIGAEKIAKFYRNVLLSKINIVSTLETAEATKIVENTFRDINIAYVNELAKSFDVLGIDIVEVINAASNKPFAFMPHFPSCGVGGHCIPVDPYYLIKRAHELGFNHEFLKMARKVNNSMPNYTVNQLQKIMTKAGLKKGKTTIGLLGLSYKANIGDLRESPALKIKCILKNKRFNFLSFDPYFPELSDTKDLPQILKKCQALILAANHKEFLDLTKNNLSNIKIIIDGKNCLDKAKIESLGITYKGIGR